MVSRLDQPARCGVAGIIECKRVPIPGTAMRDKETGNPFRESPLPHAFGACEQPRMMETLRLPCFQKHGLGILMPDHGSHSTSSLRIRVVTSSAEASALTIRQRSGSAAAISTKRAARRA